MKQKNKKKRLELRKQAFNDGGRTGPDGHKIGANGFHLHSPGSMKK